MGCVGKKIHLSVITSDIRK